MPEGSSIPQGRCQAPVLLRRGSQLASRKRLHKQRRCQTSVQEGVQRHRPTLWSHQQKQEMIESLSDQILKAIDAGHSEEELISLSFACSTSHTGN